jgi:hypothetical protein
MILLLCRLLSVLQSNLRYGIPIACILDHLPGRGILALILLCCLPSTSSLGHRILSGSSAVSILRFHRLITLFKYCHKSIFSFYTPDISIIAHLFLTLCTHLTSAYYCWESVYNQLHIWDQCCIPIFQGFSRIHWAVSGVSVWWG